MILKVKGHWISCLSAIVFSSILLAPDLSKCIHDFFLLHDHTFCQAELDGEIHIHPDQEDCHFEPVYLSTFHYSNEAHAAELPIPGGEEVFQPKQFARVHQPDSSPPLRGPPVTCLVF